MAVTSPKMLRRYCNHPLGAAICCLFVSHLQFVQEEHDGLASRKGIERSCRLAANALASPPLIPSACSWSPWPGLWQVHGLCECLFCLLLLPRLRLAMLDACQSAPLRQSSHQVFHKCVDRDVTASIDASPLHQGRCHTASPCSLCSSSREASLPAATLASGGGRQGLSSFWRRASSCLR